MLTVKFGLLPASVPETVHAASIDQIKTWAACAVTAETLDQVVRLSDWPELCWLFPVNSGPPSLVEPGGDGLALGGQPVERLTGQGRAESVLSGVLPGWLAP